MKAKPIEEPPEESLVPHGEVHRADEELEAVLHTPIEVAVQRRFSRQGALIREEVEDETVQIRPFVTEVAEVSFQISRTVNLGNFESAQVQVGLRVPCYLEEAADAYTFAKSFAEERLKAELGAVVEARSKRVRTTANKEHPF